MAEIPDLLLMTISAMTLGELRDEYIVLRDVAEIAYGCNTIEERQHFRKVREAISEEMIRRVREKYKVKP